jgi:colanic acid biosynthesis glycosyl transferase WcaI
MRLTILNQFYLPDISPTAQMAGSLAEHRANCGDAVTVVTSRTNYVRTSLPRPNAAEAPNPKLYRISATNFGKTNLFYRCLDYLTFYSLATIRMIVMPRQDVVISMTTPPFIALAALIHRALHPKTRLILWIQDCYPEIAENSNVIKESGVLSRTARAVNRFLFRSLEHIVVLDSSMRNIIKTNYESVQGHLSIEIIPNWERLDQFVYPPSNDQLLPPPPSLDLLCQEGKFIVLYLGNAGYGHRFETILDVAQALRDLHFLFLFIGGGSKWRWLSDQKNERRLSNLELHGYVQKELTPAIMARAHCAFVTMRDETVGLISPSKIHANLAMGLPLLYIGPKDSNVDEAIQEFDCGCSLRHGNHEGAIRFLEQLRTVPAELDQYRENARRAFMNAYSDRQSLPKFDRLLEDSR